MINKSLLELFYEAAHIQRWNDHIRFNKGFTELDKQAHKMIIAYMIAKFEEEAAEEVDWRRLIEGGMFEFMHRITLTDIKPPIFHRLMSEKGEKLNRFVLDSLKVKISTVGDDFTEKFECYLFDQDYCLAEKKILHAAHYLASDWEFKLIYNLNKSIYGVEETRQQIENELEEHYELVGVRKLGMRKKTYNFLDLAGQLRFQQRWAHSPRVPETSVLGHMLIVAMLAYLCSVELGACEARIRSNYLTGLFHDLPEVLTRDIISPIKRSVEGLGEIIKEIEDRQVEERILPLLPLSWHGEIKYYIRDEFKNRIIRDRKVEFVTAEEIDTLYNEDAYCAVDGEVIKGCDDLAAYIEAVLSISHGITSHQLKEGCSYIYDQYMDRIIAGLDFGRLFSYFRA
ncbi:MAG: HD domain-containing protein [Firmicutes bacterium]|jgi:putative hydrolase of HD superfamily|nr:HD domain-containing protein [Bacillota bacterium]